jgi:hypothetical protein
MADGELNEREAERVVWDVIVVGTGVGAGCGATGWPDQAAGCCSLRRGARHFPGVPGTIRSSMPSYGDGSP